MPIMTDKRINRPEYHSWEWLEKADATKYAKNKQANYNIHPIQ